MPIYRLTNIARQRIERLNSCVARKETSGVLLGGGAAKSDLAGFGGRRWEIYFLQWEIYFPDRGMDSTTPPGKILKY